MELCDQTDQSELVHSVARGYTPTARSEVIVWPHRSITQICHLDSELSRKQKNPQILLWRIQLLRWFAIFIGIIASYFNIEEPF